MKSARKFNLIMCFIFLAEWLAFCCGSELMRNLPAAFELGFLSAILMVTPILFIFIQNSYETTWEMQEKQDEFMKTLIDKLTERKYVD